MENALREKERSWQEQPTDTAAARAYVRQLLRSGRDVVEGLADLLAGRQLDLRHLLMNHCADSYGFWGLVDGIGFKITVARWDGEGWSILKHYGDRPVIDDGSMGPDPPHPTQILVEGPASKHPYWRSYDEVQDDESEMDYEDVYDTLRDALNICDGRVVPFDPVWLRK